MSDDEINSSVEPNNDDKKRSDADQDPKDSIQDSKYTDYNRGGTKANFDVHTKNGADDIIDKSTNQKARDDI